MDGSLGTALRNARLKKEITLEEAARATKVRADRLNDLEQDDYKRFPNLAYARGFLVLYAKFLGVDISNYPAPEVGSPVVMGEYSYLESDRGVTSLRFSEAERKPAQRKRWLWALLVFCGAAGIGVIVSLLVLEFLRLPSLDELVQKQEGTPALEEGATPAPSPTPEPRVLPAIPVEPAPVPTPVSEMEPFIESFPETPMQLQPQASPAPAEGDVPVAPRALPVDGSSPPPLGSVENPAGSFLGDAEIVAPRALPVTTPPPVAEWAGVPEEGATIEAVAPAPPRKLEVQATKKTKVKILRDDVDSSPVYDGWVTPGTAPLIFNGTRFWIITHDREALSVTSDGKKIRQGGSPEDGVQIQDQ